MLVLAIIYLMHRLMPVVGTARLSIELYFVQLALIFRNMDDLPQLLSVLNLDVLGESHTALSMQGLHLNNAIYCIAPLSAWGKIFVKLLTPAMLVQAVVALFLCEVLLRRLLFVGGASASGENARQRWRHSSRVYSGLCGAVSDNPRQVAESNGDAVDDVPVATAKPVHATHPERALRLQSSWSTPLLGGGDPVPAEAVFAPAEPEFLHSADDVSVEELRWPEWTMWSVSLYPYYHTLLRVLLYSYTSITQLILSFFHCQSLDSYGSRMFPYPSIGCGSSKYLTLRWAFVAGGAVFILGFPLALLAMMARRTPSAEQRSPAALPQAAEDDGRSSDDSEDASDAPAPHGGPEAESMAGVSDASDCVLPSSAVRSMDARFQLLCSSFRPEYWYWTVVVLLRRALLIFISVFVPLPAMYSVATAINVCVLSTHFLCWPYALQDDNWLEALLLFIICMETILLSSSPFPFVSDATREISAALIIVPVLVVELLLLIKRCHAWVTTRSPGAARDSDSNVEVLGIAINAEL